MFLQRLACKHALRRFVSSNALFQSQNAVARLPIPALEQTAQRYLKSIEPLSDREEYEINVQNADAFTSPQGLGTKLQQRLIEHDAAQPNSWLEDFWLKEAYLTQRSSLLINSNWWCLLPDVSDTPKQVIRTLPPDGIMTGYQVKRAARLINSLLKHRHMIKTGDPKLTEDDTLCNNQYKMLFGTCRIPGTQMDTLITGFESSARHINVLLKNQIYKLDVLHANGERVPSKEIERLIFAIGQNANETTPEPSVCILTTLNRNDWADAYADLSVIPENKQNLHIISTALFTVCLDDFSIHQTLKISHLQIMRSKGGVNRWFDSGLSLIVTNSGKVGVNGEHSSCDAVVPAAMLDLVSKEEMELDETSLSKEYLPEPVKLKWQIDQKLKNMIEKAQALAEKACLGYDSDILKFEIFGSKYIKEIAETNPDTFVQLILQLAWYRIHHHVTPVYESASTRRFLHGRTETIRSLTNESRAFVEKFDDKNILPNEKMVLFKAAAAKHQELSNEARLGQGIDRHLLGLRSLLTVEEALKEKFFLDPAYKRATAFGMSTSNMSSAKLVCGGFSPPNEDAYGICYQIKPDSIQFSLSAFNVSKKVNMFEMRESISRTLKDVLSFFPARTAVWGRGWDTRAKHQALSDRYFEKMKAYSKKRMALHDRDKEIHYVNNYLKTEIGTKA